MRYTSLYLARHNSAVTRLKKAASSRCEILFENQVCGSGGLRPDLVIKKDKKIYIIDVSIPFDNRINAFKVSADERLVRYKQTSEELASMYDVETTVIPFIVGALGSWHPPNDELLRIICSQKYASMMRKLCVSEVIGFSRDIYIQHLTDIPQRVLQA